MPMSEIFRAGRPLFLAFNRAAVETPSHRSHEDLTVDSGSK
jgi:hypothetical protein